MDIIGWLLEQGPFVAWLVGNEAVLAFAFLALTATLVAFGVPGVLLPLSFSSGALLGGWFGMLVVIAGAVLGSQVLFVATRRWLADRLRRRWGARLRHARRPMVQHSSKVIPTAYGWCRGGPGAASVGTLTDRQNS